MSTELIKVESITPIELFTKDGVDPLLGKITEEVKKFIPDISTRKGREEVASLAHKVAKTKVYLDDLGKDLVSDWKAKSKTVDDSRKKIRDYLDNLKDEVRAPLTAWENKEKDRIHGHEVNVSALEAYTGYTESNPSPFLKEVLEKLQQTVIDDSWEEFKDRAERIRAAGIVHLSELIKKVELREQEQAELQRLREEAAKREQLEREKKIAEEAARKAKEEAETKARQEQEKIEREKQDAINKQKEAERKLKEAEALAVATAKKAEEDKKRAEEAAAERERQRIALEKKQAEEEQAKREASIKHRKTINNAAFEALVMIDGMTATSAKAVIEAIAKGQVPHIKINY
jgi:hypothetical protein